MSSPFFPVRKQGSFLLSASFSAVIIAAAAGAVAGYFLGTEYARLQAQAYLATQARNAETSFQQALQSSQLALSRINQSTLSICSEKDLQDLRRLLYERSFLRDVGHMHSGQFECSASFPKSTLPLTAGAPIISSVDGVSIYRDTSAFSLLIGPVLLLERGSAFVVVDPEVLKPTSNESVQTSMFDVASDTRVSLDGNPMPIPPSVRLKHPRGRVGDALYAVECTDQLQTCTVASEPLSAAAEHFRGMIVLFSLVGALSCGFVMVLSSIRRASMAVQLRRAIRLNRIRTVYQPIVELQSRTIVEAEALARWTNNDGVDVSPEAFVREAERGGFIHDLTACILKRSLADFQSIFAQLPAFRLNVNVTAADLVHPQFPQMLHDATREAGVSPRNLALEITEGSAAQRSELIPIIRNLRRDGYSVRIDDFGTGYSSLSRLRDLDVDCLKIDRSLTQAAGIEGTVSILPQIISIADALNLVVIVEGIETEKQAQHFAFCQQPLLGQGWLFGHPVTAGRFKAMLTAQIKSGYAATSDENLLDVPLHPAAERIH